jgi:AAA15 family ATPase/GTPase
MITKLKISGFKGFKPLELPKLSRVTLLGGENNVGKTSVLEALFMFFDRLNPQMILRQYAGRGVGVIPLEAEAMWAPIFHNFDMNKTVTIEAKIDEAIEKMTIKFNPNYTSTKIQATTLGIETKSPQIRTDQPSTPTYSLDIKCEREKKTILSSHLLVKLNELGLQVDHMKMNGRKAVFLGSRAYVDTNEDAERFGQLDIIGKQEKILDILKIIEPKLKGLSSITKGNISLIHGDIGLNKKLPIAYLGDGVSRLLSITLAIATSKNGLVMIDECENGIHYSVMSKVWKGIGLAAQEFNCQVIGTTHSYECLHSAYEGFTGGMEEDFSYIRIDKDDEKTIAKTFDYHLLEAAFDANMEVR